MQTTELEKISQFVQFGIAVKQYLHWPVLGSGYYSFIIIKLILKEPLYVSHYRTQWVPALFKKVLSSVLQLVTQYYRINMNNK